MALKYVVKKTTFGFDDTKAEKYVARPFNVVNVDFKMLCDQVTKVGFVPRGTVKANRIILWLPDSLIFTPGELLKNMIKSVSIQKLDVTRNSSSAPSGGGEEGGGNEGGNDGGDEAPDPTV